MKLRVAPKGSPKWALCANIAKQRYWHDYGAFPEPHPDRFAYLSDAEGGMAVAGMSQATGGSLMVEHYLSGRVEEVISAKLNRTIDRTEIVEIGPLAATTPGLALRLVHVTPALCWCNGATALVCTVSGKVATLLQQAGLHFVPLVHANLDALPLTQQAGWGTYYNTEPVSGYIDLSIYEVDLVENTNTPKRREPALTILS